MFATGPSTNSRPAAACNRSPSRSRRKNSSGFPPHSASIFSRIERISATTGSSTPLQWSAVGRPLLASRGETAFFYMMYTGAMVQDSGTSGLASPRQRWELFEQLYGDRARASDTAWALSLLPAERLAVVDDLLMTVRSARVAAGDWQHVDDLAWRETLNERLVQVQAFHRLDEAMRGTGTVANAG